MDSIKIGKYLAELRKFYRLTQDDLAQRLLVTRQAVSKWETGISLPDVEFLIKLSELYGISINDILRADTTKIRHQKEICITEKEQPVKRIFVIGCGRWGTFLAEGYYTARALHNLGRTHYVELPICEAVYQILYKGKDASTALQALFQRSLKSEF